MLERAKHKLRGILLELCFDRKRMLSKISDFLLARQGIALVRGIFAGALLQQKGDIKKEDTQQNETTRNQTFNQKTTRV